MTWYEPKHVDVLMLQKLFVFDSYLLFFFHVKRNWIKQMKFSLKVLVGNLIILKFPLLFLFPPGKYLDKVLKDLFLLHIPN